MSEYAVRRYRELVRELWIARAISDELDQDEEADRAEELDTWWEQITVDEQTAMEAELRSNKLRTS
jgi:hypothetical protein